MLLDCKVCEAIVDAVEQSKYGEYDDINNIRVSFILLKCPRCLNPFLVRQDAEEYEEGEDLIRDTVLYPAPDRLPSPWLPKPIAATFQEALLCFKVGANTAAAIMCRKVLEGIAQEHNAKAKTLAGAIKELRDRGIIESNLFEWAEALRLFGNEAAHGVDTQISREDASDIIQFTDALLEYLFTYQDRFRAFQQRRQKQLAQNAAKKATIGK